MDGALLMVGFYLIIAYLLYQLGEGSVRPQDFCRAMKNALRYIDFLHRNKAHVKGRHERVKDVYGSYPRVNFTPNWALVVGLYMGVNIFGQWGCGKPDDAANMLSLLPNFQMVLAGDRLLRFERVCGEVRINVYTGYMRKAQEFQWLLPPVSRTAIYSSIMEKGNQQMTQQRAWQVCGDQLLLQGDDRLHGNVGAEWAATDSGRICKFMGTVGLYVGSSFSNKKKKETSLQGQDEDNRNHDKRSQPSMEWPHLGVKRFRVGREQALQPGSVSVLPPPRTILPHKDRNMGFGLREAELWEFLIRALQMGSMSRG